VCRWKSSWCFDLIDITDWKVASPSVFASSVGSELAETVLPTVAELAKQLKLEIQLIRAYKVPYVAYAPVEGYGPIDNELITFIQDEAVAYLKEKTEEIKKLGIEKVSWVAKEGHAADEIISLARKTSDNLIAMCAHGRSGVKRWVLGSVTETVVRHSGDPVLVIRAA
jgi:nucleotide-binding universal stress UspA family protein